MVDDQHSAFEAWVESTGSFTDWSKGPDGEYQKPLVQRTWLAWQAAHLGGVMRAYKWVEVRLEDYVRDHGSYDPETGATEFPGTGEEYVGELEEIIEGLRSLVGA